MGAKTLSMEEDVWMSAAFEEYCKQSHRAKLVGGPKIYNGILLAGGMVVGAAGLKACQELPRFAAWAAPKIDHAMRCVKPALSPEKTGLGSWDGIRDGGAAQLGSEDVCSIGKSGDELNSLSLEDDVEEC